MKPFVHVILLLAVAAIIYFSAWNIYGHMIDHIFTHRDTGYTPQEAIVAQRLDRIVGVFYLPSGIVFTFANFVSPTITNTILSSPSLGQLFFLFNVAIWTMIAYVPFLLLMLLLQRKAKQKCLTGSSS